ncbi:hypothetical protein [Martelella sp. HB161492]|uniref:hypothetical protein n=1 Tax=Martelella sp. HB161492 TaxID=2720726 RepID=UPI001590BCF8|nr:hypothetical protein [Martelella sp. HB161492]
MRNRIDSETGLGEMSRFLPSAAPLPMPEQILERSRRHRVPILSYLFPLFGASRRRSI